MKGVGGLVKSSKKLHKTNKRRKLNQKKHTKPLAAFAVVCFVVYAVVSIIYQQVQITQLEKQSEALSTKITEEKQQNDEYVRLLSEGDEAAYMERIAIERLGYAYPNERRFYIVDAD